MKQRRIQITTNAGTGVMYEGKHLESGEVASVDEVFAIELIAQERAVAVDDKTPLGLPKAKGPSKEQEK